MADTNYAMEMSEHVFIANSISNIMHAIFSYIPKNKEKQKKPNLNMWNSTNHITVFHFTQFDHF